MNEPTPTLPQLEASVLEAFMRCPTERGDYLAVSFYFGLYLLPPLAISLISVILLNTGNIFIMSIGGVLLLICGGWCMSFLVAYIKEIEEMKVYRQEWQANIEATRDYVKKFPVNVENMVIQQGKKNIANVGNVTTNIIDSETLRVLNRQYTVAQVILELINGAGGARKPKPFSYERVRSALTERGIGQVEHEDWAQAIDLLESGKVIDNGAAPTAWKVVKLGELASAGLDKAMREKGLTKSTPNGVVTWSAETP